MVSNNAVNQSLRRALKKLKITPLLKMHRARHAWGSILIYKGIDLITISKLLGHSDTTITQKIYLHQIKEIEDENNYRINNIILELIKY
ncbi:tyrosine-type recombinase/integrase [Macrococcoides canis]|uniref:tyrosine-type recombinase/integrase n=1 Tax=Macrococcoides canis TaxID=1855823 RepID=UPI0039C9EF02